MRILEMTKENCKKKKKHTSDGDATETELVLDGEDIGDGVVLGQADGVGDEAVLKLLDLADHLGLLLRGAVVVDDSQTTEQLIRGKRKDKAIREIRLESFC